MKSSCRMKMNCHPGIKASGLILVLALTGVQAWSQSTLTNRNFNVGNPVPMGAAQPWAGRPAGADAAAAFQPGGVWNEAYGPRVDVFQEMSQVFRILYPEQRRFFEQMLMARRQEIERPLIEAQLRQKLLIEATMQMPADPQAMRQQADALGRALADLALSRADMLGKLHPPMTPEQVEMAKALHIWQSPTASGPQSVGGGYGYDSRIGMPGTPNAPSEPSAPRGAPAPRAPSAPRPVSR